MVLSEDILATKHSEICEKLDLEQEIREQSWEAFQAINAKITLEGEPEHWFGCAIYEACWKASFRKGEGDKFVQTSCVNLKNLLCYCDLSFYQFFTNIKIWTSMSKVADEFKQKIKQLEDSYVVTYNVFEDYQPIFLKIFKAPDAQDCDKARQRNRKVKSPCNSLKVFEFCWTLYITIKRSHPCYSQDLVKSLHLLIVICDWAFKHAFLSDRRDLLNPKFKGLPENWSDPSYRIPEEAPCIIRYLCDSQSTATDVIYIKTYQFQKILKTLISSSIIIENDNYDIFDFSIFEKNYRNINNAFEEGFAKGDVDERIFLAEYRRKLLERDQNQSSSSNNSPQDGVNQSGDKMVIAQVRTPLTGRRYLSPRDSSESSHFSSSESISKLNNLLSGRQPAPSEALVQLFESCARNPSEKISGIVTRLTEKFLKAYNADQTDVVNKNVQMAVTLFYKFIESILQNEKSIRDDISVIVENELFYECIFTVSLEIVIYLYKGTRQYSFPWILNALEVQPYNFVKVIELVIRSKDQLSREIIKHLSIMEETLISSLVWKSESLIWKAIESTEQGIPKFEETALPSHIQSEQNETKKDIKVPASPNPSATDRFQSPVNRQKQATLQLGQALQIPKAATHIVFQDHNGLTKLIPFVSNQDNQVPTTPKTETNITNLPPLKPKRTGGLAIIFRKFYILAGERLEHLCNQLNIDNDNIKRQMWTTFEESVRINNCELMRDRDLDQLLMCAVYMICKLNPAYKKDFATIMKCYRNQPQATSDIYRKVMIRRKRIEVRNDKVVEIPEERDDLIQFYNKVVIEAMKKFAEKFHNRALDPSSAELLLSPLPSSRKQLLSPGLQVMENLKVKPLESPALFGNGRIFNYYFNRSPSRDLRDINRAINGGGLQGKRLLVEDNNEMTTPVKRVYNRKVQSLMEERKNQATE